MTVDALERWMLAAGKGACAALAALVLPFLAYGALAWQRMGLFKPSGYMPLEALSAAWETGTAGDIWRAPVASLNATSGELVSAMYDVTVGSIALAVAFGLAVMVEALRPRVCARPADRLLAGGGLVAALGAAPTVMLGCCGGGTAGAILALAGLSSATAADLSVFGQPLQTAVILAILARAWFLWPRSGTPDARRRLQRLAIGR